MKSPVVLHTKPGYGPVAEGPTLAQRLHEVTFPNRDADVAGNDCVNKPLGINCFSKTSH